LPQGQEAEAAQLQQQVETVLPLVEEVAAEELVKIQALTLEQAEMVLTAQYGYLNIFKESFMRYALIDKESHKIKNVVSWDGREDMWKPPEDCYAVPLPRDQKFGIGDSYDPDKKEWSMAEERKGKFEDVKPENSEEVTEESPK